MADKSLNRIQRQFDAIVRFAPPARRMVDALTRGGARRIRLPVAILLMVGGLVGMLPVLGFWMFPLGLLILAIDVPFLRPRVAAAVILSRRWLRRMRLRIGRALGRR